MLHLNVLLLDCQPPSFLDWLARTEADHYVADVGAAASVDLRGNHLTGPFPEYASEMPFFVMPFFGLVLVLAFVEFRSC